GNSACSRNRHRPRLRCGGQGLSPARPRRDLRPPRALRAAFSLRVHRRLGRHRRFPGPRAPGDRAGQGSVPRPDLEPGTDAVTDRCGRRPLRAGAAGGAERGCGTGARGRRPDRRCGRGAQACFASPGGCIVGGGLVVLPQRLRGCGGAGRRDYRGAGAPAAACARRVPPVLLLPDTEATGQEVRRSPYPRRL
ncbi:MAG: hypothetical protein AVDCRST_MAG25-182, partial [uncultured Rubrobacteraceae bacterium]